jgi:hypothetical protein
VEIHEARVGFSDAIGHSTTGLETTRDGEYLKLRVDLTVNDWQSVSTVVRLKTDSGLTAEVFI